MHESHQDTPAPSASDVSADVPAEPKPVPPSGTTRLNPKWLWKHVLIATVCLVMFVWGLIDAGIVYPNRGARAAEFLEYQYLKELDGSGTLSNERASIADPAAAFAKLKAKQGDDGKVNVVDQLRKDWMNQLSLIGKLGPSNTAYPRTDFRLDAGKPVEVKSAQERWTVLKDKFESGEAGKKSKPEALAFYDIPVQWLITALGLLGSLWFLAGIARAMTKKYSWDSGTLTLSLPGGGTLAPGDITEFDKSKWDKFYIKLKTRPDHPTFAGKPVDLDLLTYVPLEDWVLAMESAGAKR